ncbi:MAG TPA: SLC13 family permease [Thermoflexales bacterium]|nr:SLC13 family permease [Thermoflexales bacterium]HQZ21327.1 SLC13 family permease [Thermoflexales bacterium]HQZ99533.1 SLC13 family permease [Thermoflexales bacterium]
MLILALIVTIAFALMLTNKVRADVAALGVALALGIAGVIAPADVFSGFSRGAVITLIGLFIMTQGLNRTGVTQTMGRGLSRLSGGGEIRLIAIAMLSGAGLSLLMNNIAAAAMLLPATIEAARRARVSPSRVMMPLAFATELGGMATYFTTANIIVSSALVDRGLRGYGIFDFAPIGIPVTLAGIAYMLLIGRKLLPNTTLAQKMSGDGAGDAKNLAASFELQERLNEALVPPSSALVGKTLEQSGIGEKLGMSVLAILRGAKSILAPSGQQEIRANDRLVVIGRAERAAQLAQLGAELITPQTGDDDLVSDEVSLVEVVLAPRSRSVGQTLKQLHFRQRYGANVIALWHGGRSFRTDQADLPLQFGDSMLVHANQESITLLQSDPDYLVLRVNRAEPLRKGRNGLALGIVAAAIFVSAIGLLPTPEAMMLGALAMVVTGCLSMDEAYRAVEWRAIFLIAGMIPLSIAMQQTGAANAIGNALVMGLSRFGPLAVAAGLLMVATLLTQVMSGQVAAVVMAPIAISAAQIIGADPRSMSMYVALGCSISFLLLTAHPVNVFVMGAGGYKPSDYPRVGALLTVIVIVVVLLVTPLVMGF